MRLVDGRRVARGVARWMVLAGTMVALAGLLGAGLPAPAAADGADTTVADEPAPPLPDAARRSLIDRGA